MASNNNNKASDRFNADDRFDANMDEATGLTKMTCKPHKAPACGQCCMDFGLLNQLQPKIPPNQAVPIDEAQRQALVKKEFQVYFDSRRLPLQNDETSQRISPELQDLADKINSEPDANFTDTTLLVAYMCYVARFDPMKQDSIITLVDTLLEEFFTPSIPSSFYKEAAQQSRAERRAAERAETKQRKKEGKGLVKNREYALEKSLSDMLSSIENIMETMGDNYLDDRGSFMTDINTMAEGSIAEESLDEMMEQQFPRNGEHGRFEVTGEMQRTMATALKPFQVMMEHTKGQMSMEDCSNWSTSQLIGFLREHKFEPFPVPPRKVLVALVKETRNFVMACMSRLETIPQNEEQAAAVGRKSMGLASSKDLEILNKMNEPVKREIVIVEPQVPNQLRLDKLLAWDPSLMKLKDAFGKLREQWCVRQNIPRGSSVLHHEVLQTFESIVHDFDFMTENPDKDVLEMIQIFPDTESEQSLAVRPIKAFTMMRPYENDRSNGADHMPVPVVAVEWHLAKKVNGNRGTQEFMGGVNQETLCQGIKPKNLEEFEVLVALLRENRKALDVTNDASTLALEKRCTDKKWKFSVIMPADPDRKGGYVKHCRLCNKRADKTCSRCGVAAYCSRECQRSDWKVHKKTCEPKKK